ncbi:MAG TPA: alpha-galactosidase [Candidatus Dormibacteraeota bacterium]|nr:alpha-galactosidase [Candidatus Dormibacteraeota bacterium]
MADGDPFALRWQAGPAQAIARLTPHESGVVVECELNNTGNAPLTFSGWRPLAIEGGDAALCVGEEPWRASVLINGYQSWDYAGIHPLDEAIKEGDYRPAPISWWTAAICDGQAMFVAQVLKASRFATAFRWRYHRDEHKGDALPTEIPVFVAEQLGSPLSHPEQRSGLPEELQLTVPAKTGLVSDPIFIAYGDDGTATLRRALTAAGNATGARTFRTVPRGWCSWYHLGLAVTEADIARNAAFLAKRLPELMKTSTNGYRPVIQLDDGWMPRWQRWGDWMTNEFFSSGLKALATRVHRHRLEIGIWLAPFHVAADSQLAKSHPDWLLKTTEGSLLVDGRLGTPYHILDPTHPGAQQFLHDLFVGLRRDGFTYYKLDFLYGAAYEGVRHDPDVTGTQALRLGLKHITEAVNPPGKPETSFVLACGAPLMPVVGLVHGARIGGDVGFPSIEDGKVGPPHLGFGLILSMARNQAARLFFDRSLFAVDADVVMASAPQLTGDEVRVMVTIAALSGGVFMLSDDLDTLAADRLALLRNPNVLGLVGGPAAEPVHLFSAPEREAKDHWFAFPQELPPLWVRHEDDGGAVVAVYNWSDAERPYRLLFSEAVGADGTYEVTDLWSSRRGGRSLGSKTNILRMTLPPHSVRLLRMKPAADARP